MKKNKFFTLIACVVTLTSFCQNITVDSYPIPHELLLKTITPTDQAWITNDTLNQTLVIELYTDYHQFITYHFYNSNIAPTVLNSLELYEPDSSKNGSFLLVPDSLKQSALSKRIDSTYQAPDSCFTSTHQHQLGESLAFSIKKYGTPHHTEIVNNYTILTWNFLGSMTLNESEKQLTRYAIDSFGLELTMVYKAGILVGRIIVNDIP